jgi:hypothetical protein
MRRTALAIVVAAALGPVRAEGFELTSTWLTSFGSEELRCRAVNTGKKPATVLVELIASSGLNIATTTIPGCDGTPLAPNAFCSAVVHGAASAYCRVTTKSKAIRAGLGIAPEAGGSVTVIVPATK